ncbi:hypothetical protein SLA2020_256580 [Shorea laevis]
MTSLLPLSLNFPFPHKRPHSFPYKPFSCSPLPSRPFLCFSSPSNFDREEVRWLREEQRWLREEQRWLREEQRWLRERESILQEISALKLQIQSLENRNPTQGPSVSETIASIGALLQVLKEKNLIAESGTSAREMALEEKSEEVNEMVVEQGIRVLERERRQDGDKMKSKVLRKGSEGDDVQELQEALEKLGFYSGEEDMEYSSFSDGTERAVKTWQATIGSPENGIMTAELLERLYMGQRIKGSDKKGASLTVPQKDETNGAAVASITEISEIQQKVVEEDGITEVEVSQQRVFLLGENRWEEPSRLIGRDKQVIASKAREATTKCLTCRGEGRLMCTECDGTGEPNIEPQFLEWVDEGAKCPYCEGLGYITCDVCEGKMVT